MKVTHVSYRELVGGAPRAANRLHRALLSQNVDSTMYVRVKDSDDRRVEGPSRRERYVAPWKERLAVAAMRLQKSTNASLHSPALLPSGLPARLTRTSYDVLHLHWVNAELLSVEDIGRLRRPIVWTLHDMWAFCGSEHYTDSGPGARWRRGYSTSNRPACETGLDVDRLTWLRKQRSWRSPFPLVCPSRWLATCVEESALLSGWPVHVIPNTLDTHIFRPHSKQLAREVFGLSEAPMVLFGATGGTRDPRKGYHFAVDALRELASTSGSREFQCVVFGQTQPAMGGSMGGLSTRWLGHLHDEWSLALLYSAADVVLVPSTQESFGQTAAEAQACGTPVVAFDSTGLKDVVEHLETGYLAECFKPESLGEGLRWVLGDDGRRTALSLAARDRALRLWTYHQVALQHLEVYAQEHEAFSGTTWPAEAVTTTQPAVRP